MDWRIKWNCFIFYLIIIDLNLRIIVFIDLKLVGILGKRCVKKDVYDIMFKLRCFVVKNKYYNGIF